MARRTTNGNCTPPYGGSAPQKRVRASPSARFCYFCSFGASWGSPTSPI